MLKAIDSSFVSNEIYFIITKSIDLFELFSSS